MDVRTGINCGGSNENCSDLLGCPNDAAADFCIKRHDTRPEFRINVEDCDGPIPEEDGIVLEVNMWSKAKLKKTIEPEEDHFALADNIGFYQIMVDDVIIMDQIRSPEQMKVIGFDESNKIVFVERGYNNSEAQRHLKGSSLRIFRAKDHPAQIEYVYEDIVQTDGSVKNQLVNTFLICYWTPEMTCLPGCYWLEFKLIKMNTSLLNHISNISFTPSLTPDDYGCSYDENIEWMRRFPLSGEGFLIKIIDSPTAE